MLRPEDCKSFGIPERLISNGRSEDQDFHETELIFRRFSLVDPDNKNNILSDGRLSLSVFSTRRMSCVREKYIECPEDALFNSKGADHFHDWGIFSIPVGIVQKETFPHPAIKNLEFHCKVFHDCEECMYPHVEVRVFNNNFEEVNKISPSMKTDIKKHFQKYSRIYKEAKPM